MPWSQLLFSFQGRITRRDFWWRFFLPTLGIWIVAVAILPVDAFVTMIPLDESRANPWAMCTPLMVVMFVASLCASVTVGAKRLHDCNRSGWFMLCFVTIPVMLLVLGFLRGTRGPNRFERGSGIGPISRFLHL